MNGDRHDHNTRVFHHTKSHACIIARHGGTMAERSYMTKYQYKKISTMRTFAESTAKWFMLNGIRVTRKDMEKMAYVDLQKAIKSGKVMSVYAVK